MTTATEVTTDDRLNFAGTPDGAQLGFLQTGSGGIAVVAPLCFGTTLDGLGQAGPQRSFFEAIGAGHELVAYDQRGAGASRAAAASKDWDERGQDLWAVADAAGVQRAVLYGVFDACITIIHAALQQPERVLGLVFNLVPPTGRAGPVGGSAPALREIWLGDGALPHHRAEATLTAIGLSPADAEALTAVWSTPEPPASFDQDLRLYREADLASIAPALQVRSLVIEPQRRPLLAGSAQALSTVLPAARLIRPARAGEMLGGIHGFLALIDIDDGHFASHLAPAFSTAVGATEHTVTTLGSIVVPVVDTVSSERAAEMACRLGGPQRAEIVLVHVIEVPHTRALDQVSEAERARGEHALRLGQAIASHHGMQCRTRLLIERSAAQGIVRVAAEESADLIVMAMGEKRMLVPTAMSPTMREVMRRARCEVLIDQAQGVGA